MLVLTRKTGEDIFIGDDIHITVVRIDQNRVRIGVEAPNSTTVLRGELYRGTKGPGPNRGKSNAQGADGA